MVPEVQKPSQEPCIAFYPKRRIRNLLREKHFHGVSSGSRHEYLLKSRYGKVSTAHRHAMCALSTLQTPVFDIPHLVRITTCEHLMHEGIIVGLIVTRM